MKIPNKRSLLSITLTLTIITLLIFSGPVSAVTLTVNTDKSTYRSGNDLVTFTLNIDIETAEQVPIQNITLLITPTTGNISANCTFTVLGSNITTCPNINITSSANNATYQNSTQYGYGYGYNGSWAYTNTSFGYGYGYYYNTDFTDANGELRYTVTWNITSANAGDGSYSAVLQAYADDSQGKFFIYQSPSAATFTINATTTNNVPVLTSIGNLTAYAGTNFIYDVNATDADSDTLTFASNSTIFNISSSTGIINFTPTDSQLGVYAININVTDNAGGFDNETITFTVNDNTPPIILAVSPNATDIDKKTNITIKFSENMSEQTLTYSNIQLRDSSNTLLKGLITFNDSTNTTLYNPYIILKGNETYTVTVTTGVQDSRGVALNSSLSWNFTTTYDDTDNDGIPDINDTDDDGDSITDTADYLKGDSSNINTNILNLNITINESFNLSQQFNGTSTIKFYNASDLLIEFNYTFSNTTRLDLTNVTIYKNENSSTGSLVIRGFTLPGNLKKTVYLDNLSTGSLGICIRDSADVVSVTEITSNCTGTSETWLLCPGSSGDYTCAENGSKYRISGLTHSAVTQANDTAPPTITAKSVSYSGTTTVTVTLDVTTDEAATCKFSDQNLNYSSMNYTMSGATTTSHTYNLAYTTDTSGTYYILCQDIYGNLMTSPDTTAFSADVTSTTSSAGGGGGGAGTSSNVLKSASQMWSSIQPNVQTTMNINKEDIAFTKLLFVLGVYSPDNPKLTVSSLIDKPSATPVAPPGTVYQYLKVDRYDIYDVSSLKISFRVKNSWLTDENIDQNTVTLYRYHNRQWNALTTTLTDSDDTYTHYEAVSPDFSYFAIAGTTKTIGAEVTPENVTEGISTEETIPKEVAGEEKGEEKITPKSRRGTTIIIIISLLLLVVLLSAYIYLKKQPREQLLSDFNKLVKELWANIKTKLFRKKPQRPSRVHPKLLKEAKDFIRRQRSKGKNDEQIKTSLLLSGWPENKVEDLLKDRK
jgi:PGF-pre-PGF domain-containing protein